MATDIKDSSTNIQNLRIFTESWEVNRVLEIVSPRWKMQILFYISKDVKQFGLLKKVFPTLSDQMLGKRLKELVNEGFIEKTRIGDNGQKQTVYFATAKATQILEIMDQLHQWGKSWNSKNK